MESLGLGVPCTGLCLDMGALVTIQKRQGVQVQIHSRRRSAQDDSVSSESRRDFRCDADTNSDSDTNTPTKTASKVTVVLSIKQKQGRGPDHHNKHSDHPSQLQALAAGHWFF